MGGRGETGTGGATGGARGETGTGGAGIGVAVLGGAVVGGAGLMVGRGADWPRATVTRKSERSGVMRNTMGSVAVRMGWVNLPRAEEL